MQKMRRPEVLRAGVNTAVALQRPWVFASSSKPPVQQLALKITAPVAAIRRDKLDSMTCDAIDALGGNMIPFGLSLAIV
jgi:hypothetical protein